MTPIGKPIGRAFKSLTQRPRSRELGGRSKQANLKIPKSLNYEKIKADFEAAVLRLSKKDREQIPVDGTLPERMAAYALVKLGIAFTTQNWEGGGRLYLGGAVVDIKAFIGATIVIIRVQGDYWHSLKDRIYKDAVQYDRLVAQGYIVLDLWEHDLYQAWADGRLVKFVEDSVNNAQ